MEQMQKAIAAIEEGNARDAHLILARIIKAEPDNVDAWLLLSRTAASPEQRKTFLRRALLVDPDHPVAQAELAALEVEGEAEVAASPVAEQAPPAPVEELSEPAVPAPPQINLEQDTLISPREPLEEEPAEISPPEVTISDDPFNYDAQAEGGTIPPWMADQLDYVAPMQRTQETPPDDMPTIPDAQVPEWLQDEPAETWLEKIADEAHGRVVWKAGDGPPPEETQVATPKTGQPAAAAVERKAPRQRKQRASQRGSMVEWGAALLFLLFFLAFVYLLSTMF